MGDMGRSISLGFALVTAMFALARPAHAGPAAGELIDVMPMKGQVARDVSKGPDAAAAQAPTQAPDWRARVGAALEKLQAEDPALVTRLSGPPELISEADLRDRRAAAVLLSRLLKGADAAPARRALAEALPQTGGDWQEGAAALIASDPSPEVRKQLVELMRYAEPPHCIEGLRRGFRDPDPEVNIAAARTTGFSRSGGELFQELFSSTFDADWDLRAAAVQALGMLRLPRSRELLIKALADEEREVRLQALLALEQLDPEGVIHLPQLEKLARDRKSHRIARKAELLLRRRRAAEKGTRASGTISPAP